MGPDAAPSTEVPWNWILPSAILPTTDCAPAFETIPEASSSVGIQIFNSCMSLTSRVTSPETHTNHRRTHICVRSTMDHHLGPSIVCCEFGECCLKPDYSAGMLFGRGTH